MNQKEQIGKELLDFKNWDKEKIKYKPANLAHKVIIYLKKEPQDEIEKSIKYCGKCFQNQKTSIIQLDKDGLLEKVYICHTCGSKYRVKNEVGGTSATIFRV